MAESHYVDGVLRELWDDTSRVYSNWDAAGTLLGSRVYTPEENEAADDFAARSTAQQNRASLAAAALSGMTSNREFIAIASPSSAQVAAQVRALTRQSTGLMRLVLGQLDATD